MKNELSHTDSKGKAQMVDVGHKPIQKRIAEAEGKITLQENTLKLIQQNLVQKGDVLTVAKIAGIQAAKQTANLIPLCHTLLLNVVDVNLSVESDGVLAQSIVKSTGQTGVEMEALSAVSVALLTIYDMCKAVDKEMVLSNIRLISKTKEDVG
jgi:cyclic pyranopterin monophosphate synthase